MVFCSLSRNKFGKHYLLAVNVGVGCGALIQKVVAGGPKVGVVLRACLPSVGLLCVGTACIGCKSWGARFGGVCVFLVL